MEESFDRCRRRYRVLPAAVSLSVEACASLNGKIPPEIDAVLWKIERGTRFSPRFSDPHRASGDQVSRGRWMRLTI